MKHAFAIDPPGPAQPDEAQARIIERVCREIVRRRLTTPAMMALEMGRPLNHLSAQVLTFFKPFVSMAGDAAAYDEFTAFLEQRGSIDYLSARLEALEATSREPASGSRDSQGRERRAAMGPPTFDKAQVVPSESRGTQASDQEGVLGPRDKE